MEPEAKAALRQLRNEELQQGLDHVDDDFDRVRAALNAKLDKGHALHYGALQELIEADARRKIWKRFARWVAQAEEGQDLVSVFEAFRSDLQDGILRGYAIKVGLSRSTSVLNNLLEDAESRAVLDFLHSWYDM